MFLNNTFCLYRIGSTDKYIVKYKFHLLRVSIFLSYNIIIYDKNTIFLKIIKKKNAF